MNLLWLLVVVFIILAIAGTPNVGPWNHGYGYWPTGGFGFVVIVLLILLLSGRL